MTEPFSAEKELKNLKEIYDAKTASKAEVKKAIINNLPKADNPAVKDFNAFLGVEKDILPGQLRKEKQIERHTIKKSRSMRESAIIRDATIMASAEYSQGSRQSLKELHKWYMDYYRPLYEEAYKE